MIEANGALLALVSVATIVLGGVFALLLARTRHPNDRKVTVSLWTPLGRLSVQSEPAVTPRSTDGQDLDSPQD